MTMDELFNQIRDAAFRVRKTLAPGFLESVYQNALIVELGKRGLLAEKEYPINVYYDGVVVGEFRADIMVEKKIILEIKAVKSVLKVHETQLVNYLVATGVDWGFLINYGSEDYRIIKKSRIYIPPSNPA